MRKQMVPKEIREGRRPDYGTFSIILSLPSMRALKFVLVTLLSILLLLSPGCRRKDGDKIQPHRVQLEWSYAGGVVKGKIYNRSRLTISSVELGVQVVGDFNQILGQKTETIRVAIQPQGSQRFEVNTSIAGGKNARVYVEAVI